MKIKNRVMKRIADQNKIGKNSPKNPRKKRVLTRSYAKTQQQLLIDTNPELFSDLQIIPETNSVVINSELVNRLKNHVEEKDPIKINPYQDTPEFTKSLKSQPITEEQLTKISKIINRDKDSVKMREMVGNIPLDYLSLRRTDMKQEDYEYRFKPGVEPRVTDQFHSGRCWLFASLNTLRYQFIKKLGLDHKFEFSSAYLFFYDKLERANLFLETMWNFKDKDIMDRYVRSFMDPNYHFMSDGGYWQYFMNLVSKYGLVPKSVYTDSYNCMVSDEMNKTLISILNRWVLDIRDCKSEKSFKTLKTKYMKIIYDLLVRFMGEPPKQFNWRYKDVTGQFNQIDNLTPEKFYRVLVPHSDETKITIIHDPRHPENYYKFYFIEYACNMVGGTPNIFFNLPMNKFKEIVTESLKNEDPVWFGCDVMTDLDFISGIMDDKRFDYSKILGVDTRSSKADMLESLTLSMSHAMVFNGVDLDENKDGTSDYRKFRVENSWGINVEMEWHPDSGYWQMSDSWFEQNVAMAVVDIKYFDPETMKTMMDNKNQTVTLKPWDIFGTVAMHKGCESCKYKIPLRENLNKLRKTHF